MESQETKLITSLFFAFPLTFGKMSVILATFLSSNDFCFILRMSWDEIEVFSNPFVVATKSAMAESKI